MGLFLWRTDASAFICIRLQFVRTECMICKTQPQWRNPRTLRNSSALCLSLRNSGSISPAHHHGSHVACVRGHVGRFSLCAHTFCILSSPVLMSQHFWAGIPTRSRLSSRAGRFAYHLRFDPCLPAFIGSSAPFRQSFLFDLPPSAHYIHIADFIIFFVHLSHH